MAIYRYTLNKYFKSKSTWIISIFTFIIIFLLAGYVPFSVFNAANKKNEEYAILSIAIVSGITGFLVIFTSVFSGFKAASMFKDEVEDGSFLVILSKPIKRSKIIIYKWLALQTLILIYTFLSALTFLIAIVIFDKGDEVTKITLGLKLRTLKSQVLKISSFMWLILFISSLIFSSISLLLSTKLSVGSTIGISIALGVIIPVTSLVGQFTKNEEYSPIYSNNWNTLSIIADNIDNNDVKEDINSLVSDGYFSKNIYLKTQEVNSYKRFWPLDFNYHFSLMSKFAYSSLITEKEEELLTVNNFSLAKMILNSFYTDKTDDDVWSNNIENNIKDYNYSIAYTWLKKEKLRKYFLPLYINSISSIIANKLEFKKAIIDDLIKNNILQSSNINWKSNTKESALLNLNQINNLALYLSDQNVGSNSFSWIYDGKVKPETISQYIGLFYSINGYIHKLYSEGKIKEIIIKIPKSAQGYIQASKPISSDAKQMARFIGVLLAVVDHDTSSYMSKFNIGEDQTLNSPSFKIEKNPTNSKGDKINNSMAISLLNNSVKTNTRYTNAINLIKNGYSIHNAKLNKYINKDNILYIYIIVALSLIPLSYFGIKRKDFR